MMTSTEKIQSTSSIADELILASREKKRVVFYLSDAKSLDIQLVFSVVRLHNVVS